MSNAPRATVRLFVVTDPSGQVIGTATRDLKARDGAPTGFSVRPLTDQKVHELEVAMDVFREVNETGDIGSFHRTLTEYLRSGERQSSG